VALANNRHVAKQHVEELRHFIDTSLAHEPPDFGDARIVFEASRSVVLLICIERNL
jgi:hypothetical protein